MQKFYEICVGVSTFNGQKTLHKTLTSLEEQTFKNFSVFICDDASTDKTVDIIKMFCDRNENFFYEVNKKNIGMIQNNNNIFLKSNSKYFTWVDQDDFREKNYLYECYNEIEKNKNASLVFAKTGVINKQNDLLMHINTINSVSKKKNVIERYKNLLINFHDTIIYSLIKSDSLKKTQLWTNINGSANKLIFELSLQGEFLQVDKLLSFYTGRGLVFRYSADVEYYRQSKKKRKFFQVPFLVLFICQFKDIFKSQISLISKFMISFYLINNFCKINFAKFFYRFFSRVFFKKFDNQIYLLILKIIPDNKDLHAIVKKELYPDFYPPHYPYKKIDGINKI